MKELLLSKKSIIIALLTVIICIFLGIVLTNQYATVAIACILFIEYLEVLNIYFTKINPNDEEEC